MAKAADPAEAWRNRDLVRFYSGLTRGLEERAGQAGLAAYLANLRRQAASATADSGMKSAVVRFLRRLGFIGPDADFAAFLPVFLEAVGEAVARPPAQVLALVRAQARGIAQPPVQPLCGTVPQCLPQCGLTKECDWYNSPRKPALAYLSAAERLLANAERGLSDAEVLALCLFGDRATGQEPLVTSLLGRYGRLRAVFRADPHEYAGMRDCSSAHTLRLAAVSALYRRLLVEKRGEVLSISCAKDLYDRYAPELRDHKIEAAVLVMLDAHNNVIRDAWFTGGASNVAHLAVPELLRPAIREEAAGIALVHNHPSGNAAPSSADREFTRRLRSACDYVGLVFLDHVIVAEDGYFSFTEEEMLDV